MTEITEELTPAQIVAELDKYIIGQANAKRAVAVALRNRYRRKLLPDALREEVIPKNILMIGPTGVGKTEIARRLALLAKAPFIKVEATKFTEVGYVGRDVDSMIRDLVQISMRLVEAEKIAELQHAARERATARIVEILHPSPAAPRRRKSADATGPTDIAQAIRQMFEPLMSRTGENPPQQAEAETAPSSSAPAADEEEISDKEHRLRTERIRERLRQQVESGVRDDVIIDITVEERQSPPLMQFFAHDNMEDSDIQGALSNFIPRRQKQRKVTIAEARQIFMQEEAQNMIDRDSLTKEAIARTEQSGIIFVDEIDKIAGSSGRGQGGGPDVSREGVQRDILPIIEGSTVNTKLGPVRTDHILFIAAGAFHIARPSDLIPELQGRLPIRVELENLSCDDFKRILTEPQNALTRQYAALLATEGVELEFLPDGISELARLAAEINERSENIGARRLHTLLERLLEDVSYNAPELPQKHVRIDGEFVRERLADIVKDEDLARYIL